MDTATRGAVFGSVAPISKRRLRPLQVAGVFGEVSAAIRQTVTLQIPGRKDASIFVWLGDAAELVRDSDPGDATFGIYRNHLSGLPLAELSAYGQRTSLGHVFTFIQALGAWIEHRTPPDAYTFVFARGGAMWMGTVSRLPSSNPLSAHAARVWLHKYDPGTYCFGAGGPDSATETIFVLPLI